MSKEAEIVFERYKFLQEKFDKKYIILDIKHHAELILSNLRMLNRLGYEVENGNIKHKRH